MTIPASHRSAPAVGNAGVFPAASTRAHAIVTGALIGWFSLALLGLSILFPHAHHSHMSHGALLTLAAVASVGNGAALWLSRKDGAGTTGVVWAWAASLVAFFAAVTHFAGGFTSDLYVLSFPVVVFAATVLPPTAARASGLFIALLYVGTVMTSPAHILMGDLIVRAGSLLATGVAAAELSAIARQEAARRAAATADAELRAALLQELHHRVKNDLQSVAALLSLDAHREPPTETAELLDRVTTRMQSIATVHGLLALQPERADAGQLIGRIASMLEERSPGHAVDVRVDGEPMLVRAEQASCLALAVNELITNALQHAFPDDGQGHVSITVGAVNGDATVAVADDGVGVSFGFGGESRESLGLELVRRLVSDGLGGRFDLRPGSPGTVARLQFPIGDKGR